MIPISKQILNRKQKRAAQRVARFLCLWGSWFLPFPISFGMKYIDLTFADILLVTCPTILEYFAIYSRMFDYLLLNTFAAEFSVPLLPDLKNLLLARFWVLCLHVSFLRQYYLT